MRRAAVGTVGVLAILLLGGCDTGGETVDLSENTGELTVDELGRVGARIYLAPHRAETIVAAAGLTATEFEERVRSITNDPGRSLTYARAFEEEVTASRRADSEDVGQGNEEVGSGTAGGDAGEPPGAAPAAP